MTIIITPHAEQRMKDRRIASVQIGMILQGPKEIIRVKYGRLAAYGNIRNRKLVIIYEKRNENIKVITVLWVDKRRLKTLGFTRI